ncbi:MAG: M20/M25/M40 family metallo-hydrolase [bacterium]|nr:M20/M25/M40 family metallo-hydrolase [bacterium]
MQQIPQSRFPHLLILTFLLIALGSSEAQAGEAERLVAAMLEATPLVEDLRVLTDEIGGRPTGSEANLRAVAWAVERFREAGVEVRKEAFPMPALWLERSATARVEGDVRFSPRVAAMPFSTATPADGFAAPLVDGGWGSEDDFERLGEQARGAFVLVETRELLDIPGLFEEYAMAAAVDGRAFAAGVAGVVYMGARSRNVLNRHNASLGPDNQHPMLIMERDGAGRALRLLRHGKKLRLWTKIDVDSGGPYDSYNVIGEIKGSREPEEFVVVGAHLDSWDLGTGALDNACNVALVIDLARQMRRLGLQPRRTIRFAIWNGEEQGMIGSWEYTRSHASELDRHVMASSYDTGSGRISGFLTNGQAKLLAAVDAALEPVRGLGPFVNVNEPLVGTDNYDFMMQGIGNLVADQESADYGPNYHARSDTFDKVGLVQLRINAAVAAAVTWAFAEMEVDWPRMSRGDIEQLIESTKLGDHMRMFGMMEDWETGKRGRVE